MLHASTLDFLRLLDQNNNKLWFDENRKLYEAAKQDFEQLVGEILRHNVSLIPELEGRKPKDCVFRIYKDVRFSKDKTPYKNNFGAAFGKTDKKVNSAGFYLHLQPNNQSFVGGGIWMPDATLLKQIRQEIDYNFEEFSTLLHKDDFKKTFGGLDKSEQLKKCPKGYSEDNPAIEYLKLKSFTTAAGISDKDMLNADLVERISDYFKTMKDFIDFLNRSIS